MEGKAPKNEKGSSPGGFGPAGLAGEERRDGHGSEVYAAVDEGFVLELEELLRASAYVVGKSRSGIVYKVVVNRGASSVAVRRLSEADDDDDPGAGAGDEWRRRRAFESEAITIGRAKHPNVVRLLAYYYAPDERLLIYDYIPNGTLHAALHGQLPNLCTVILITMPTVDHSSNVVNCRWTSKSDGFDASVGDEAEHTSRGCARASLPARVQPPEARPRGHHVVQDPP